MDIGLTERKVSKTQKDKETRTRKNENERTKMKEMCDAVECMKQQINNLSKIIVEIVSHENGHNAVQQDLIMKRVYETTQRPISNPNIVQKK